VASTTSAPTPNNAANGEKRKRWRTEELLLMV